MDILDFNGLMIPHWFPKSEVKELGRFVDFHKLSEGGYGEVFTAMLRPPGADSALRVVVKKFKPHFGPEDKARLEKFLREARLLKTLSHPSIPRYIDGFVSGDTAFYVMEYVEGQDINKILYQAALSRMRPCFALAFHVLDGLLEALDYLHGYSPAAGRVDPVIHGDVKPKNLMLQRDLRVRLLDFSTSQRSSEISGFLGGSLAYAPLEFFTGGRPSPQFDLYSASAVFFDLLTFRQVLDNVNSQYNAFAKLAEEKNLETVRAMGFPGPLENLLLRGLAKQSADRFASAREFRTSLAEVAEALAVPWRDRALLHETATKFGKIG